MSSKDELFSFEKEVDNKIAQSVLFQLPLRSVLTSLYGVIDSLIHGNRFGYSMPISQTAGEALSSRLSYLTPFLQKCTSEIGISAINALSPTVQCVEELQQLIYYAHFCELMPEVRRGYYEVQKTNKGFELIHPNENFSRAEEYDILLTELSLAFVIDKPPNLSQELIMLAGQLPKIDLALMHTVLAKLFQYRSNSIREVTLLEPIAFETSIGVTWDEFCRVRTALFAYADYSVGLANALEFIWLNENDGVIKEKLFNEFYEWIAVFNNKDFLMAFFEILANVDESVIERVLSFFTIDFEKHDFENVGEGFFPPLTYYSHSYLFSPYILRLMLSARNILYVLNKRHSTQFDNLISHHLEPTLIKQASAILETLPDLKIVSNKNWSNGEFDLLVYQSSSNTVLHVEAKAPIPPQGARMTRAVENRSKEGIKQLNRFQGLPQNERDFVISEIFNTQAENVHCVSVLLCRAGLGTHSVWELGKDITILNLQLLNGVVQVLLTEGLPLSEFRAVSDNLLNDIRIRAVLGWKKGSIVLNGVLIEMPLLQLNYDEVYKIKCQLSPI